MNKIRIISDGGVDKADMVGLSNEPLDIMEMHDAVKSAKAGAISSFLGTTRDTFEDKNVTHLEYEAYPEMALQSMFEICDKIRERFSVVNIIIKHKLGPCPVLECSVAIIISSAHRKDSLHAVEFGIDELKKIVPIWKKEFYDDGETNWKSNEAVNLNTSSSTS